VTESEKENIAVQSLRNRGQAGQARKDALITQQQSQVEKAYIEAQYARAKANEEEVLRELKALKTEHHLLKLEFSSAKLQHSAHVKHLERDILILQKEKVNTVRTLTENYDLVVHGMLGTLREKQEEVIEFLGTIVELCDGLKVKQIKLDTTVDIEQRTDALKDFREVPLESYVKDAKAFLTGDPLLVDIGMGIKEDRKKTEEEREKERLREQEYQASPTPSPPPYESDADLSPAPSRSGARLSVRGRGRSQEEEERRKAEEAQRVARDREERARVRSLADEHPKLAKQVRRPPCHRMKRIRVRWPKRVSRLRLAPKPKPNRSGK
jgi:hypothetical protein